MGAVVSKENPLNRLGIYLFYDENGVVDDYVIYMLAALKEHCQRVIVVCNGAPADIGVERLERCGVDVMVRENIGFDVYAYKEAIERVGRQDMRQYDEILLMNYTFFGPIFPLREMFDDMDARDCDFWGITAHAEAPSPFQAGQVLPFHIQSHFIAVRRRMFDHDAFWRYWGTMPMITSYTESILQHEARFTQHFSVLGFMPSVYMEPADFSTAHPIFIEVDRTIEKRCPILKRRPFFHDPLYLEAEAIDVRRALDLVRAKTEYPADLIWRNIIRSSEPRVLYTNAELLDILPPVRLTKEPPAWASWRIAALVHMYYPSMVEEIARYLANIPIPFDLYVTTDTGEKQAEIRTSLSALLPKARKLEVRVVDSNDGRDSSALLITCRDIVLEGKYDLICRLHSKRSPQDGFNRGNLFKQHLFDNLLGSTGYVQNLLDLAAREASTGIFCPTVVHIGYPTLGHAWFYNRERVRELCDELGLSVKFDQHTPLAALGSMFWFRPEALRPMFEKRWKWSDFGGQAYGDGDLPHALERLTTYCAQSEGYLTRCVMTSELAAKNYVKLEYKYQILASCFPTGDARGQIATMLQRVGQGRPPTVRETAQNFLGAIRRSIKFRWQRLTSS